jgi:hypothetical protein
MFTKPKYGTIVISNNEIDVEVTQWWVKGINSIKHWK